MSKFLLQTTLLFAPALAVAAGPVNTSKPVPSILWAPQAVVPPGTTGAQALPTVLPAVGVPAGAVTSQPGAATGAPPSQPGGRFQTMPPSVTGAVGSRQETPPPPPPAATPAPAPPSPSTSTAVAPAEAIPMQINCRVTLRVGRTELNAEGGEFLLPAVMNPPACDSSIAYSAQWLQLTDEKRLQFVVEPHTGSTVREVMILVGDRSFLLRQMPPPQIGLAAAPSRLVFGVNKRGDSSSQLLTAWTERPSGNFTLRPGHPWLTVTAKKSNQDRQVYEIAVKAKSGLPPGRHDSWIEVLAAGSGNASLTIPVVVEVEGVFY